MSAHPPPDWGAPPRQRAQRALGQILSTRVAEHTRGAGTGTPGHQSGTGKLTWVGVFQQGIDRSEACSKRFLSERIVAMRALSQFSVRPATAVRTPPLVAMCIVVVALPCCLLPRNGRYVPLISPVRPIDQAVVVLGCPSTSRHLRRSPQAHPGPSLRR